MAAQWTRGGRTEVFALGQYTTGDTTKTSVLGAEIRVADFRAFGFGLGYNLNDHLNLNLDMFFSSTDITGIYMAPGLLMEFWAETDITGWDLNLDFNLLKRCITPLVTGGIGFINLSSDSSLGSINETDFSYALGVGFRWDATDHFLVKGMYKAAWTELEDTEGSIMLDGINIHVGYMF